MTPDDDDMIEPADVVEPPLGDAIDLHTFLPAEIPSLIDEYVRAAYAKGLSQLRIVHGRGKGVQRGIVQAALERHPLVVEFWDDADSRLGATFCRLMASPLPE
jgi:dsDNA-specific endonuclease/ATPase MutS2